MRLGADPGRFAVQHRLAHLGVKPVALFGETAVILVQQAALGAFTLRHLKIVLRECVSEDVGAEI